MSSNSKGPIHVAFEPAPPTVSNELIVTFPAEHVLQLTLNRPTMRNAMSPALLADLERTLAWFDTEPSLW